MKKLFPLLLLVLLAGCEKTSTVNKDAGRSDVAKACARAYGSTEAKLKKTAIEQGLKKVPELPSKEEFVAICEKFPLDAAKCMDPVRQMSDPEGCAKAIGAVPQEHQDALRALFQGIPEPTAPAADEAAQPEGGESAPQPAQAVPATQ